ncbi:methyltransferase domain-containing protein [Candidatus Uabimicrobium sp. HlEnr_7]|uniref:methyltransferase domain-containing protein n=1 Tax=Candidatus Uabimicrobium helgolandensis TaxID=3095367 RepID=UPI003555D27D
MVYPSKTIGLDSSEKLLKIAQTQTKQKNLRFIQGNAYKIDFPENYFDFIYNRFLYQHLSDPLSALRQAHRITKKGGKVIIMDVDDSWFTIHPEFPEFSKFTEQAAEAQKNNGGDRFIARKLPHLMKKVGFSRIEHEVLAISSINIGLKKFIELTTQFKVLQIQSSEGYRLLKAIEKKIALQENYFFGIVAAFIIAGTK